MVISPHYAGEREIRFVKECFDMLVDNVTVENVYDDSGFITVDGFTFEPVESIEPVVREVIRWITDRLRVPINVCLFYEFKTIRTLPKPKHPTPSEPQSPS